MTQTDQRPQEWAKLLTLKDCLAREAEIRRLNEKGHQCAHRSMRFDPTIKGIRDCSLGYVTCCLVARGYCPDFTPPKNRERWKMIPIFAD